MADILILFPPDKKAPARSIAEALAAERLPARLAPLGAPEGENVLEAARAGGPVILLWSRSLVAAALCDGWLPQARKLRNLIEVSTDGIAPLGGDESRVVLLSGWRGQPFHLGWQRIVAELQAAGAVRGRAEPARANASDAVHPGAKPAAAQASPRPAGGRRLALPALAAAALLGVVGAAAWVGTKPAQPVSPGPAFVGPTAPQPVQALQPIRADIPEDSGQMAAPGTEDVAVSAVQTSAAKPKAAAARSSGTRVSKAEPTPARSRTASATAIPIKNYSRKRSKVMRKFCARAGRQTLECRIFARSTATARR